MAEYIEREALREILGGWRDAHADVDDVHGCGLLEDVICEVDAQTAADVALVVRCKDCKHFKNYGKTSLLIDGKNIKAGWCHRRARYDEGYRMPPDGFCSYGERRDRP